ncbi:hypothetical protein ACFVFS_05660 [Kitasatospora sp. NPDC057692]|uniref:hypothetical protein n=1 Tax=Kitasatospora sp. NPDC057692 TaxID=3346215 RepID=UPI0036CFACC8
MTDLLTAPQLQALANALAALEEVTDRTGVTVCGYNDQQVTVGDVVVRLRWDPAAEAGSRYAIDLRER